MGWNRQHPVPHMKWEKKLKLKLDLLIYREKKKKGKQVGRHHRNQLAKFKIQDVLQDKSLSFCYQTRGMKKGGRTKALL